MGRAERLTFENTVVVLFTHNTVEELKTVLASMRDNLVGFRIFAFDDASSNPYTRVLLQESGLFEEIWVNDDVGEKSPKVGGLYQNLQRTLKWAKEQGSHYVFALADDEQIVAPVTDLLLEEWSNTLNLNQSFAQLNPRFVTEPGKKYKRAGSSAIPAWTYSGPPRLTDHGIYCLSRLRVGEANGFRFGVDNSENRKRASNLGLSYVIPRTAVIASLPFPRIHRKGQPSWRHAGRAVKDTNFEYKRPVRKGRRSKLPRIAEVPLNCSFAIKALVKIYPSQLVYQGSGWTLRGKLLSSFANWFQIPLIKRIIRRFFF